MTIQLNQSQRKDNNLAYFYNMAVRIFPREEMTVSLQTNTPVTGLKLFYLPICIT